MVEREQQPDIVDEAFETLRQSQVPQGPSLQALEQTLQAVHQAQRKSERISLFERIRNMNKFIKYPVAAAIVLAVFAGGAYLLISRGAGVAFADVKQQIDGAQTMTMTLTTEMKALPKPITTKMFFKCPGHMRQEITAEVPPGKQPDANGPAARPQTQTTICIFDMQKMQALILDPNTKTAGVIEYKNLPKNAMEAWHQDFLAQLKQAVAGKHEDLGEKTIAGEKVKGYRCLGGRMIGMDIWVDASTGVPVQIDASPPNDMGTVTMTDFVINPKLDDSLFSLAVPEGYKVEKQSCDFHVTEEGLIKGLRVLATACGGAFPKTLILTPDLVEKLDKAKASKEEGQEIGKAFVNIMAFQVTTMNTGGEFVYAGEGVKLGDKDTPVLWYKAKDAKTYRVIYGDLHIENAEKAPPRPATQPAGQ